MAKQAVAGAEKPGVVVRLKEFIQEVKVEMSKVSWPSQEEIKSSTQVVMILLAALAGVVCVYDIIFGLLVRLLLGLLG